MTEQASQLPVQGKLPASASDGFYPKQWEQSLKPFFVRPTGGQHWATPVGPLHPEGPTKKSGRYLKDKKWRPIWAKDLNCQRSEGTEIHQDLHLHLSKETWYYCIVKDTTRWKVNIGGMEDNVLLWNLTLGIQVHHIKIAVLSKLLKENAIHWHQKLTSLAYKGVRNRKTT